MKQMWASAFWDSEAAACLLHAPPCSLFSLWADCNRKSAQTLEDKRCDSSGCSYSYCTQVCVTKNNRDYAARESAFLFQRPQYKIIAVFFRSAFAFSYVFVFVLPEISLQLHLISALFSLVICPKKKNQASYVSTACAVWFMGG